MTANARFLAFDLGAESGRAVVGHFEGERLRLEEVHRFSNGPVRVLDSLHWDVLGIWSEIKHGLKLAVKTCGEPGRSSHGDILDGIGLDTWGVDFGLLTVDDTLLGNPHHYRDSCTDGMMEEAFRLVPRAEIFQRTGIQFMQLNSLYQLLAMARSRPAVLATARTFLNMPDLFDFWLTGRKANEFTIATTSQCYDPSVSDWARTMLDRLGIPSNIFGEIVPPGTVLGMLRSSVCEEIGCPPIPVIAPATHDTGSAVAAVPANDEDYIYLSSGTWSLMGVEVSEPVINDHSLAYNFTNEGGLNDTFRLLKNIMGLWLVQECRREWARVGEAYSYDDLTRMAAVAPAFSSFIAPGDPRFLSPGDIPARIQTFCLETGQAVPKTKGQIVRCILESLAMEYRWVAKRLDELVGHRLPMVHIIGGGSRNRLLNQFTADATGRTVVAGPVEATAIGNVLVQALARRYIASLAEGREIVRHSFEVETFEPRDKAAWDEAHGRYLVIRQE